MHGRQSSSETTRMFTSGTGTEDSRFKLVNDRLKVLMADAHDIFVADIFYHKKCYSSYLNQIRKKRHSQEETKVLNERKECEVYVMKRFLELFRKKELMDRNTYLMTAPIQGIHEVSFKKKTCQRIRKFYWILYCWQKTACLLQ